MTRFIRYTFEEQEGWAELLDQDRLLVHEGPQVDRLEQVQLLPPVNPTKIIGIGRNYRAHAEELNNELPAEPLMFMMPSTSVIASGQPIIRPGGYERVDYEGELAIVFSQRARNVPAADAAKVIAGYCCFNDVTVRDLQKQDGQFTRAKGFDTFAPLGPCLATDIDPFNLRITTRVDGEVRQDSNTSYMIFSIPRLVQEVTRVMTMLPGDVIATGTPAGVGQVIPGSVVEIDIEQVGVLSNPVIAEEQQ